MQKNDDTDTEILSKLGILNSKLESPHKMNNSKLESRRRAAVNLAASSLSDDSDSEIVFDRNALLNARKRRRRQRSTRITNFLNNETLRWKLFCLSSTFLCLGLASVIVGLTKPDIMTNVNVDSLNEYAKIFSFCGLGYFVGAIFVSLIFTRLNSYICVLFLLGISVPFTTLIIYQSQIGNVKFFLFFQGLLFGAIERGAFFIVYGILKGDKRTLFMLYMAFAAGGALSSIFTTEEVFSRATVISQQTHLISKREIANFKLPNETLTTIEEVQAVTRPHAAFGIDDDPNTKTRENTEKRKQALNSKDSTNSDCIDSSDPHCQTTGPNAKKTTAIPTQLTTQSTTTQKSTTISSTITTTTQVPSTLKIEIPANTVTFNRARNRLSATTQKPSIVDQMKDGFSEQVHKGLAQVNTAPRFAYVLIMVINLITIGFLFIGFCACCIRCKLIADPQVAQIALDAPLSAQIPNSIRFFSVICWFLQSLPETIIIAFLPHYILSSKNPQINTQNNTAFFNCTFWIAVTLFRAFISACPNVGTSAKWIKICYFLGLPLCFIFHHLFPDSEMLILAGFFTLGFFMNSLPQMTFAWLQSQLDTSSYLLTKYYFGSIALSKAIGPLLTVWAINNSTKNQGLITLITLVLILSLLFFILLTRSVNPLARQRQIFELTGDINGRRPSIPTPNKQKNRKGQYEALIDDQSDADVEMEYVDNVLASDSDSI